MIRLSQAGEYAIRGILFMASHPYGTIVLAKDVAEARGIPKPFLAKILQNLAKSGILRSHRGSGGGFSLARPAKKISLLEVIESVEGAIVLNNCLLLGGCQSCKSIEDCPVGTVWTEAQNKFIEVLESTSFEKIAKASNARSKKRKRNSQI